MLYTINGASIKFLPLWNGVPLFSCAAGIHSFCSLSIHYQTPIVSASKHPHSGKDAELTHHSIHPQQPRILH